MDGSPPLRDKRPRAGSTPIGYSIVVVPTATIDRHDVLHFQGKLENGFWRIAILTPVSCPERYLRIIRRWERGLRRA
jgi:hypothetical protein